MEDPSAFCEQCGEYLTRPETQKRFCSRQCAGKAKRGKPMRNGDPNRETQGTCEQCGGPKPRTNGQYCSRDCFFESRGFSRMEYDDRSKQMIDMWASGEFTLEQIGQEFGITRERVRQIIKKFAPNLSMEKRAASRLKKLQRKVAKEQERSRPRICKLCGIEFRNASPTRKYCYECSKDYQSLRMICDPERHEKHRLAMAIMHLRRPEGARVSGAAHALQRAQENYWHWKKYGYLPPPNRRYVYSAKAQRFLERIGIERWHEILDNFENYYADETRRIVMSENDFGPLPGLYVNPAEYENPNLVRAPGTYPSI